MDQKDLRKASVILPKNVTTSRNNSQTKKDGAEDFRHSSNVKVTKKSEILNSTEPDPEYLLSILNNLGTYLPQTVTLPDCVNQTYQNCIKEMSTIFELNDYNTNLLTFWLLETFVDVLRMSQENNVTPENQKIILIWIGYVLHQIVSTKITREDLFQKLEEKFMKAQKMYLFIGILGKPEESLQDVPSLNSSDEESISKYSSRPSIQKRNRRKSSNKFLGSVMTDKIEPGEDVKIFIESIYTVFANRFKFELISQAFSNPNDFTSITIVESIRNPKPYSTEKAPVKGTNGPFLLKKIKSIKSDTTKQGNKTDSPKSETKYSKSKTSKRVSRNTHISIVKSVLTILTQPENDDEEELEKTKHKFILPLSSAIDSNFYNNFMASRKYFAKLEEAKEFQKAEEIIDENSQEEITVSPTFHGGESDLDNSTEDME